jgi:crotonobetainyl-CoA:carnitine CoA-transferase CaiB-like acyl-CoA transferase
MKPLDGISVLDFSQGGAGPYCAQLLADYGAEVIKLEPPRGDWSRTLGTARSPGEPAGTYLSFNRNKRGLCMDLNRSPAVQIARELALKVDVIVESFRPGVMDRWHLGYEDLAEDHPTLIYCSISGFGQDGPYRDKPATDTAIQSRSGLMSILGEEGGAPLRMPNVPIDHLAGVNGFASVLLALQHRNLTGAGSHVGTSLLSTAVAFQAPLIAEYSLTGELPVRRGNRSPFLATSDVTRASDGYMVVTVLAHQWEQFCAGIDRPDLVTDERFVTNEDRSRNRAALWQVLGEVFAQQTVEAWVDILTASGVMASPVVDYEGLVEDPQVRHSQLIGKVSDHRGFSVPVVRSPIHVGTWHVDANRPPPSLGQHSAAILHEYLGLTAEQVDRLRQDGVVIQESDPGWDPGTETH